MSLIKPTKGFLIQKYVIERVPLLRLVEITGLSYGTLYRCFIYYEIPIRDKRDALFGFVRSDKYCKKMSEIKKNKRFSHILTREFLIEEYVNKKKTAHKISKEIGCGGRIVVRYLKEFNIPHRNLKQAMEGIKHIFGCMCWGCRVMRHEYKGKDHPNWQGGISRLPYSFSFNSELKEKIRTRDNFQCQNRECNMTEEEHLIVYGTLLHVHHIDYDKLNCHECNLISTCLQCNIRANHNRDAWKAYYIRLLQERKQHV